jgi:hypothetical protein
LNATVTKTGMLRISGSASVASVLNTGPGLFDGFDLETSEAKVTIKDSGNVSLQVDDELRAFLDGAGIFTLKGEPRMKKLSMGN